MTRIDVHDGRGWRDWRQRDHRTGVLRAYRRNGQEALAPVGVAAFNLIAASRNCASCHNQITVIDSRGERRSPGSQTTDAWKPLVEANRKAIAALQADTDRHLQQIRESVSGVRVQINSHSETVIGRLDDLSDRFAGIEQRLDALEQREPAGLTRRDHIVIVADQQASYWPRLSEDIERARGHYSGIRVAKPPDFSVPLPQLVLYRDGVPIYRAVGAREVNEDLNQIQRGTFQEGGDAS